jgi:hypothetical protein
MILRPENDQPPSIVIVKRKLDLSRKWKVTEASFCSLVSCNGSVGLDTALAVEANVSMGPPAVDELDSTVEVGDMAKLLYPLSFTFSFPRL